MKNEKNILILDSAGNLWGSERVLLDFMSSNYSKTKKITLCCPRDSLLAREARKILIPVNPYFIKNLHLKSRVFRLAAALGLLFSCVKVKADVIYVNQAGSTKIAALVGKLLGIPVIPHVRIVEDVKYIERLDLKSYQIPKIIVISKYVAQFFQESQFINRVSVIYDGYKIRDANDFAIRAYSSQREKRLCCVGRLVRVKGQDFLLKSLDKLRDNNIFPKLSIYGVGLDGDNFANYLIELTNQLNLNAQVEFKGFNVDVVSELVRYHSVVIPSHVEPLGRVIFEAWNSYCIPIAGKFSGGAAEIISASQGGILYDDDDPSSIALAIQKSFELSDHDREEMIGRGRSWMKSNCDIDVYTQRLYDLLELGF